MLNVVGNVSMLGGDFMQGENRLTSETPIFKRLDAIIESSYDGIYITDGAANTLMVNKAYETITGLSRDTLIGHSMFELEARGIVSRSATLLVLKEKRPQTIDQKFQNGKSALVSSSPILDADGNVEFVITNVRDITALLSLQEQVDQSMRLAERYCLEIEELRGNLLAVDDIIAQDEKMLETLRLARRVAKVDATALIQGETGVGKEEVAKFIYKNSGRNTGAYLKINCGAIPENLLESELFGYEPGAFTGAGKDGKMGLFELANGGTLFLDEIGELPLEMQVKILRALQEQEITRVGGVKAIKVDVRILAATNQNLELMISEGRFRKDLYYRLNVIPITVYPLRERREDILPLVRFFTGRLNDRYKWEKTYAKDVLRFLYDYSWPGNIRELKNIVERLMVMSDGDMIMESDLRRVAGHLFTLQPEAAVKVITPLKAAVEDLEQKMIASALKQYGNVRDAALALRIDASTLVRKRQRAERRLAKAEIGK